MFGALWPRRRPFCEGSGGAAAPPARGDRRVAAAIWTTTPWTLPGNVGLAVGTDAGLLVPVIEAAESKSLVEITRIRGDIVEAARRGKLVSETQATFTISNLGMFGIREFSAIINPPECAALAVGTIRDEVRPDGSGGLRVRRILTLTLSADHRLVDGLVCARYLNDVKAKLEDTSWL